MNPKKIKSLPLIAFLIGTGTVIYTWFGILELSKLGGPCNAGLALIILIPTLLICVLAQAISLHGVSKIGSDKITIPVILSAISFLLWTYWFHTFSQDNVQESLLYFGPFEIFSILILALSIWKAAQSRKQYFFDEGNNIHNI